MSRRSTLTPLALLRAASGCMKKLGRKSNYILTITLCNILTANDSVKFAATATVLTPRDRSRACGA